MPTTIPIATPEQAAKFRKELFRPYVCPEPGCGGLIGGKVDPKTRKRVLCGHRHEASKLPEANAKTRPWAKDVTLSLPKVELRQWLVYTPKDWRRLSIYEVDGVFRLHHAGSMVPVTPRDLATMGLDPFAVTTSADVRTLAEIGTPLDLKIRAYFGK
jgi:hypothetical protein